MKKAILAILTLALLLTSCAKAKDTEVAPVFTGGSSTVEWASNAATVEELVSEADLIVRVRVVEAPVTRVLRHELSVWDENNKIVGSETFEALFSDTVFEVVKTYLGESPSRIIVMQTGGYDPTVSKGIEEAADDPLYKVGEGYILFLVNVSGDHIHAPDRELYRIVNPYGRYGIDGETVFSYGQNSGSDAAFVTLAIKDLEMQIEQAVDLLKKPD